MSTVRIVEVGPRDGLQNETASISTEVKLRFVEKLSAAGLHEIEATSFVSPKWVPQLGDAAELWPVLPHGPTYWALVPNLKGWERAHSLGVDHIALFTAASDEFTRKNINMSVAESLSVFRSIVDAAPGVTIRGYVSTAFECPYAGKTSPKQVRDVVEALLEMGVSEVSIGDTIGVAVPREVRELTRDLPVDRVAYHFHDTRGSAIANVAEALECGVRAFDSSAAGLGGCPYAPGAGGNLATEDLVYFLERSGIRSGVDLQTLARASLEILDLLGRRPTAKSQLAALAGAG